MSPSQIGAVVRHHFSAHLQRAHLELHHLLQPQCSDTRAEARHTKAVRGFFTNKLQMSRGESAMLCWLGQPWRRGLTADGFL